MRVAIVGFPFSGKSTLFSAISGIGSDTLNPTGENLAAVKIPEPRLDTLEEMYKPKKRTEATMEFVDLPGGASGETEDAGLAKHLPTLRQTDALLFVLRGFQSDSVPAHGDRVDPKRDFAELRDELLLADLVICDNRVEKLEKAIHKPTKDRDRQKAELELLKRCRVALEGEQTLSEIIQPGEEEKMIRSFGFLTQKPLIAVINVAEDGLDSPIDLGDGAPRHVFNACAAIEAEIMQVDAEDRAEFLEGYGITSPARDRIIRACFEALGMIFFLTAGEEEVRSWPIPAGISAQEAAGKIHSDLARGFIRAETVAFDDLVAAGNFKEAKTAGKVRQEPKAYVVQDGDVINIKFNV